MPTNKNKLPEVNLTGKRLAAVAKDISKAMVADPNKKMTDYERAVVLKNFREKVIKKNQDEDTKSRKS